MFSKQDLAIAAFFLVGMQGVGGGGTVTAVTSAQKVVLGLETRLALVRSTDTDVVVKVTMINHGPGTILVLRWDLPRDGQLTNSLFEITRDGKPVEYHGKMVKRRVTTSDYIRMKPGKYSATIGLAQAYDVKPPGHYTVRYSVFNQMTVPIDSNELVIERK